MVAAVSIAQVHKYYGQLAALREVDFDIPPGSFFGLLGPNGAGKSTLINIMAGLVRASQGHVQIMGYDVQRQWRQARHTLGVVPQELVYDPFFTVSELLRLQSGYFGYGKKNEPWLEELIHILGLTDKAHTNLAHLSGGMKRRVLIAQALVHKPPVVVLDEPTAGVDVELRKMLWTFTQQLHQKGHTIVLTTHYLEEAEALCEQIAILNQGQLVALDSKTALLARYPYRLLRLNLTDSQVTVPDTLRDKIQSFTEGELILRLHREQDSISAVLDCLRNANIQFVDLHTQEPGLEEVFLSLTARR
ncbi:ABC transporter [Thioploca ingrica]|uniref:ABC transporter n=1 Tax=Thioploca ingrica TaxID=40754 RepID=A0A090AK22_9GAMM|nr:ABC transporter [Thioploca ingrica]